MSLDAGDKQRATAKTARNPIPIVADGHALAKPDWIRVRAPGGERFEQVRRTLREHGLHSVCEEAACPNIGECFGGGTATFMILGDICTRRCPFCDVAHGRPLPPDNAEPQQLADAIAALGLR
ncbi:MAG: lipoyl synthase, partial [Betaproteobacteria bacterium]|nr:lipoyl synthase [Betaproteobacteria bacterium]